MLCVYLHIYKVFSLNKIALLYIYCYKTLQAESGKFKKQSQHYEVGLVVEKFRGWGEVIKGW